MNNLVEPKTLRNAVVTCLMVAATTWLAMVAHSIVLMLYISVWQATTGPEHFDLGARILTGLAYCIVRPDLLALSKDMQTYTGIMYIAYLLVLYGPVSMLWASPSRRLRYVAGGLALLVLCLLAVAAISARSPLLPVLVRILAVLAVTGVGIGMERLRVNLVGTDATETARNSRATKGGGKYKLGFTLVEVLVVIAILLVLAAISLAVMGRARKSAYVTREINQVRQVYIAVNLYEADFDGASPPMLASLDGAYLQSKYLTCPTDERLKRNLQSWPANPWINIAIVDPPELRDARSSTINSYFYLKTFEARFAKGHTYEEYRSSPQLGLIAGAGLLKCGACKTGTCIGNCEYWMKPGVPSSEGHPPVNMSGDIVIVRTDGSVYVRKRPDGCPSATLSHMQLFLDGDLNCDKPTPVSSTGPAP